MSHDRLTRLLDELDDPRLPAELAALSPRELVWFDQRVRCREDVPWARAAVLRLFSADGFARQDAVESVGLTPLTVRALLLRCVDWVPQVREAALARVAECPGELLVEALPLAERLAAAWSRGELLEALLDARLTDDDLRAARRSPDASTRRAAWLRLARRGAVTTDELESAARSDDLTVRRIAVDALVGLPESERRSLARVLLDDRVGWIAARALAVLVALDGTEVIGPALMARSATLRRAARDWARVRGMDARAVYLERAPDDERALLGLAEIGDRRDLELIRGLLDHRRARLRDAGLRALASLDRPAARKVALRRLVAGHGRVATSVLRTGAPNDEETAVLTAIAVDRARPWRERERALALLKPGTWTHFTVAMEASMLTGVQPVPPGRPAAHLRPRIERLLGAYSGRRREAIEFALR